jgi:hypothetical protein
MRGRSARQLARRARIVQELRNSSMRVARSRRPTESPAVVEALAVTVRGEIELNGEATARAGTRTAAAKTRSVAIRGHPKGDDGAHRISTQVESRRGGERIREAPAHLRGSTEKSHQKLSPRGKRSGVLAAIEDCRVKIVTRNHLEQHGDKSRIGDPLQGRLILQPIQDPARKLER